MQKTVSIIIPTYNRSNKILRTINSIIKQTYTDWELIIIDDCSNDDTQEVLTPYIKKYPISYGKLPRNCGPSKARNIGMSYAKCE